MTTPVQLFGFNLEPVIALIGTALTMAFVAMPGSWRLSGWKLAGFIVMMGLVVPGIALGILGHFHWLGV